MVSEQPQQFLIQLMSGDIDPNMMMDEDAYTAEQIEDLKLSIKEWLGRVPFTEFRNAIHKDVIGQDNLDLILANVYNYLTNVALGNPVNNNMLMAAEKQKHTGHSAIILKQRFQSLQSHK